MVFANQLRTGRVSHRLALSMGNGGPTSAGLRFDSRQESHVSGRNASEQLSLNLLDDHLVGENGQVTILSILDVSEWKWTSTSIMRDKA